MEYNNQSKIGINAIITIGIKNFTLDNLSLYTNKNEASMDKAITVPSNFIRVRKIMLNNIIIRFSKEGLFFFLYLFQRNFLIVL